MTDPPTLRNISAPPKGGESENRIWDESEQSVLLRGLVRDLALLIPPMLRSEIERRLPGMNIGDIEAGHVLFFRTLELSDGFELGYYVRDDEIMRHHKVTLIDEDAVDSLASAFSILAGWQEQERGDL